LRTRSRLSFGGGHEQCARPFATSEDVMDELIAQIATKAGLDIATARQAAGIVLAFLQKEAPPEELSKLFAALPGAETLALTEGGNAGGGGIMGALGGLMGGGGGGLMALAGQLGAAGLSMDQMQTLGHELYAYGREKAGEDTMGAIIGAVPGLGQFA
jgi:hypothetical protein